MKIIIIIIALLSAEATANNNFYLKVGAGYKFYETSYIYDVNSNQNIYFEFDDPISARIEIGMEHENISYGISHHSNWFTGYPFNDKGELQKTEIFIDYKFSL